MENKRKYFNWEKISRVWDEKEIQGITREDQKKYKRKNKEERI